MKPHTLTPAQTRLLARPDLAIPAALFTEAARLSRLWDQMVAHCVKRFGERPQGGHVSGIYSEHLPAHWQTRLRNVAQGVTREGDHAWQSRPARVRSATMRDLRLAVIARDGSGFYG